MFIPDPECRVKKIPDPDPHQRIEVFLTKKTFQALGKLILGWFFSDLDFFPFPDPGFRGLKDTVSRILIGNPVYKHFYC
jgi:hypothetical protein